jgi:predicted membrane protein
MIVRGIHTPTATTHRPTTKPWYPHNIHAKKRKVRRFSAKVRLGFSFFGFRSTFGNILFVRFLIVYLKVIFILVNHFGICQKKKKKKKMVQKKYGLLPNQNSRNKQLIGPEW